MVTCFAGVSASSPQVGSTTLNVMARLVKKMLHNNHIIISFTTVTDLNMSSVQCLHAT